jgi:two-component system, NarL family, invasion response regulator UvrY
MQVRLLYKTKIMKKISLAIVDDHKLIRQMLARMFADHASIEVTGEGKTLQEAIEMIKSKRPDIVLLDINLEQESGFDAVPLIRKFSPGTRIIAMSMHKLPRYAKKMIQLGAKAYVTKNSSQEEIVKAVEEVMKGNVYICTEIKDIIAGQVTNAESEEPGIKDLSFREIEIIKLMKDGLSSREISLQLKIAIRTVEVHRHNILKKLQLKNTASLLNFINNSDLIFL